MSDNPLGSGLNKLDEILSVPDRFRRASALLHFARSLGVDLGKAKETDGHYNEEKLAVLIYDGLTSKKKVKKSNINFLAWGALVAVGLFLLLGTLPRVLVRLYEAEKDADRRDGRQYQGYDVQGNPVMEGGGQPVTYKMMEGVYEDYYDNGRVKYEYEYKDGRLIRKKKYDRNTGRVLFEESYP